MSEIGPATAPGVPSYQLDRARLDEEIHRRAVAAGVEAARPAEVVDLDLGWPESRVTLERGGERRAVRARWVVDATGRTAIIARRLRLMERLTEHQTAAMWARWEGVTDLDGLAGEGAGELPPIAARRRLATNHFCGYGWWCWMIPLAGGQTSIGLVWDKRHFTPPAADSRLDSYRSFLAGRPGLSELLEGARVDEEDFRTYGNLAYRSRRYAEPGWALVGDAAAFIDPYYSPGLDHAAISIVATARLLARELGGELEGERLEAAVASHNRDFERSFSRWYRALYQDKYELLGDAELTTAAFLLETSLYYLGVVDPVYSDDDSLAIPVLGDPGRGADLAYGVLRTINRRLVDLARFRRRVGTYGRRNAGWRFYPAPFGLRRRVGAQILAGLKLWGRAELERLRHRIVEGSLDLSRPVGEPPRA